jgi:hypothetical protein
VSQYFECPKCEWRGSKADMHIAIVNDLRVEHGFATWCGGCNPTPPPSEWGYAYIPVAPNADEVAHKLLATGVKRVWIGEREVQP